jgi:putative transposase
LCRVLEVSRSGFYAWAKRGPSARALEDRRLATKVRVSWKESRRTYGRPRILADLREGGEKVSAKRVARLMEQDGIVGVQRRRRPWTTRTDPALEVAANVLDRDFNPSGPNKAWASDITYVRVAGEWVYLAVIIDLFSRKVIGWNLSDVPDTDCVLTPLETAKVVRRIGVGVVHHSDRGCQYASARYRAALQSSSMVCSMSRKGNCWDNAVVESFFGTLKAELPGFNNGFDSFEAAAEKIGDYIDDFYNVKRRHSALGYVSPVAYEVAARTGRAA